MSYPEKGASYRNKPAWLDRAVAGEKRAQGGPVSIGNRSVGNGAGVGDIADAATEDAKDDLSYAMNKHRGDEFHDSGLRIPGKLKAQNDRGRPPAPGRADGGRMEPLIDEKGNPNPGNYWDHLVEPSSPHAAQDARNDAAERTRRAAVSPRTPGPITKSLVAAGAAPLVLGRMTADTVKGVADRINSPDNREQIADGMGRSTRRRGGAVRADGGEVNIPKKPVPMPTVQTPDTGDRMEGTPSESNKPSFLRGKKPL